MAVFAPTPNARVMSAISDMAGVLARLRRPYRMSRIRLFMGVAGSLNGRRAGAAQVEIR
jgi:hypothetical protein